MNNRKKGVLFLVILFIAGWFIISDFKIIKKVNPVIEKSNLAFYTTEYDFKELNKGVGVSKYFVYKNIGDNNLKITDVQGEGLSIIWSEKELNPGKKDSILVSYDSKKVGYFSKSIHVTSNSESSPNMLYVKGTVYK